MIVDLVYEISPATPALIEAFGLPEDIVALTLGHDNLYKDMLHHLLNDDLQLFGNASAERIGLNE